MCTRCLRRCNSCAPREGAKRPLTLPPSSGVRRRGGIVCANATRDNLLRDATAAAAGCSDPWRRRLPSACGEWRLIVSSSHHLPSPCVPSVDARVIWRVRNGKDESG